MEQKCGEANVTGKYILRRRKAVPEPDLFKWANWFEVSKKKRVVARTIIDEAIIATVFLGVDHNFASDGEPLLFETFTNTGEIRERCSTWKQAKAQHKRTVRRIKKARKEKP